MSRKILAPMVRHAVWEAAYPHPAVKNWEAAKAQLRALLAVARAARTLIGPHPGEAKRATDWDRCARALAKLDKVSGVRAALAGGDR